MKLVFAIVNNEDGNLVMRELNKAGFSVTKMASTGGFLRAGNTTLLVGTEEEDVQKAVDLIAKHSMKRKQIMFTPRAVYRCCFRRLCLLPRGDRNRRRNHFCCGCGAF